MTIVRGRNTKQDPLFVRSSGRSCCTSLAVDQSPLSPRSFSKSNVPLGLCGRIFRGPRHNNLSKAQRSLPSCYPTRIVACVLVVVDVDIKVDVDALILDDTTKSETAGVPDEGDFGDYGCITHSWARDAAPGSTTTNQSGEAYPLGSHLYSATLTPHFVCLDSPPAPWGGALKRSQRDPSSHLHDSPWEMLNSTPSNSELSTEATRDCLGTCLPTGQMSSANNIKNSALGREGPDMWPG
ncbi:hypothetical protein QBC37DRAFT_401010 [Rhypophila decipiens]|uniref:Uncharacterized protein n=1 Tax=Rhypophila decipiens TaxID=261697 RepID=A0AAN6Y5B7_9PEZI|nr:hypothetical protein QBC37DRAFT_401010 [Rhypophila decipiens]